MSLRMARFRRLPADVIIDLRQLIMAGQRTGPDRDIAPLEVIRQGDANRWWRTLFQTPALHSETDCVRMRHLTEKRFTNRHFQFGSTIVIKQIEQRARDALQRFAPCSRLAQQLSALRDRLHQILPSTSGRPRPPENA